MSTNVCLFSELGLTFETERGDAQADATVWIRSRVGSVAIALNMSPADRAKLRSALDRADAIADKA